jgi:hypothetical protein
VSKVIAVDFDGTLCDVAFPKIGKQTEDQKELMKSLIDLRSKGCKLILWTNRGNNLKYPCLDEAVQWCRDRGLEFDSVNENIPNQEKLSGPSPKVMADVYLDDKALNIRDWRRLIDE